MIRFRLAAVLIGCLLGVTMGCQTHTPGRRAPRTFDFERDIFSYTNNNYWLYDLDSGQRGPVVKERLENVDHGQRCTVMARTARQFWYGARFEPDAPRVDDDAYRRLIRRVLATSPRAEAMSDMPVVIPGYADLRALSRDFEAMLKEELKGRWIGYWQRGNWRMIFPFSSGQKRAIASELMADLDRGHLPLVHVVNYPIIDVNHTVLLFGYTESPLEIRFEIYDPNSSTRPGSLVYDRTTATFLYNRTDYFAGGSAKVYEIYDGPFY